jgi:hypothetical protein
VTIAMNRIKIKILSLILNTWKLTAVLVSLTGCSDYLEQLPDQRTELNTPEKVAELVASAYPKAVYITFLEAMTDNAEDKGITASNLINSKPWFFDDVPGRNEDTPDFYWFASYEAIASANHALEAIENANDQSLYNASKGEALVARAYAHFMLVTLFAKLYDPATADLYPGIPYVTETEKVVIKKYDRKTVAYVYDQIEKDLTEGLPLIDNTSYKEGAAKYHFTTVAAHAFATRFYLFKKDYKKVIEHADQAFPGTTILSNLRPVNSKEYLALEPLIKETNYTRADQPSNLLLVEAPSLWARSLRSYRYGFTFNILKKFVWEGNPTTGEWSYSFYGATDYLYIPKFREHFVKQDPNANIGVPYNMIPLFSAEEVLFNKAEANIMSGNYDAAINELNTFASTRIVINLDDKAYYDPSLHSLTQKKIRDFYNTLDTKEALINTLLDFKRVEFFFEGMRWFDIIRHNIPVVHQSFDKKTIFELGPNNPHRIIQIPQEAERSGVELNPR